MSRQIQKLLVANRGEIALRIIRTCREMGIRTVALYSDPDRSAIHVQAADEAYPLHGMKVGETYLDSAKIIAIARSSGADALHPGYGFLSENPQFAQAVISAGLVFVGPPPDSIRLLGDKTAARALATQLGIPTIAGSEESYTDAAKAETFVKTLGFPILLKAAAGGGGKGMRIVDSINEFDAAFRMATSEAKNAFGDPRIYVEKYLRNPHHVEIQVLADRSGHSVFLGERDCSIQRRHQKIIEESPSPILTPELRARMGEVALQIMNAAKYSNAGTVEFLVDEDRNFYFLEVNTRLQVEHPVTEAVTRVDLVREQISVASGNDLPFRQQDIRVHGHALECRVYAEDPSNNFLPSVGRISSFELPTGPNVRVDSGARARDNVTVHYDPMLAKLITWGGSRSEAISTMTRALEEFVIIGVRTTIPFCRFIVSHDAFLKGIHTTQFINQSLIDSYLRIPLEESMRNAALIAAAMFARQTGDGNAGDQILQEKSKWVGWRKESMR